MIDKECRNQKAGNDLRAFRWGAVADHPYLIYLHPTLSFANKASEKGRERSPSVPVGGGRESPLLDLPSPHAILRQQSE